jgi:hypothetical protein
MNTKIKSNQIKNNDNRFTVTIDSSLDGVMRFRGVYTQTTFPNVSNARKGDLIIWSQWNNIINIYL